MQCTLLRLNLLSQISIIPRVSVSMFPFLALSNKERDTQSHDRTPIEGLARGSMIHQSPKHNELLGCE